MEYTVNESAEMVTVCGERKNGRIGKGTAIQTFLTTYDNTATGGQQKDIYLCTTHE